MQESRRMMPRHIAAPRGKLFFTVADAGGWWASAALDGEARCSIWWWYNPTPFNIPRVTVILLPPPLPAAGVSIGMERECQLNDSLADG